MFSLTQVHRATHRRVQAVSDAGNDPANKHLGQAVGCDLEDGTNGHDGRPKEDRLLATNLLAEPGGGDGPKKTTHIVDSRNSSYVHQQLAT